MAKRNSQKQLLKAIVLTIGVADCAGIYIVNNRLSAPVPDSLRFDMAYALTADQGIFRPDQPNSPSFAMAPTSAVPQAATQPAARSSADHLAFAAVSTASQPVAARDPVAARRPSIAHLALGSADFAHPLAAAPALQPQLRVAGVTIPVAAVPIGTVTAALKAPAVKVPGSATALFKSSVADAASGGPVKAQAAKSAKTTTLASLPQSSAAHLPGAGARQNTSGSALRNLVPVPRHETLFAAAFANLDASIDPGQLVEAVLPRSDHAGAPAANVDFAHNSVSTSVGEGAGSPSTAAARTPTAELPAVNASFVSPSA